MRGVTRTLIVRLGVKFTISTGCGTWAHADGDLPSPIEPSLAEPGDWAADFNDAQVACFNGSMSACDSIYLNSRVLFDTFLHNYGRSCGGRVNLAAPSPAAHLSAAPRSSLGTNDWVQTNTGLNRRIWPCSGIQSGPTGGTS
jgi:hypothetical protein